MSAADPVTALVSFLSGVTAINALVSGRVYGGEVAKAEVTNMPRAAIVVSPAGGLGVFGGAYQEFGDRRFDVDCYAASAGSSYALYLEAHAALKQLSRVKIGDVILHWARPSAGGNVGRDPQTDWPVTLSSWQVLAHELAVA